MRHAIGASGGIPPARSLGIASLCALDTLAHGKALARGARQASEVPLDLVERQAGAAHRTHVEGDVAQRARALAQQRWLRVSLLRRATGHAASFRVWLSRSLGRSWCPFGRSARLPRRVKV
eukprot:scaffold33813_cov62-Phaeocystis_antarctica.AAC.1